MNNLIEEVKKENEKKEIEIKKEKIRSMLALISVKEKEIENLNKWVNQKQEEIFKLKDQLEKEDYSAVQMKAESFNFIVDKFFSSGNITWNI